MLRKLLFFAFVIAVVWLVFQVWRRVPKVARLADLNVRELHQGLRDGQSWLLIDVRGRSEYNDDLGHIAMARHVPLEALAATIARFAVSKEQPIALICRTDSRARQAQELLIRMGYPQARVVRGGMQEWVAAKLPVERG